MSSLVLSLGAVLITLYDLQLLTMVPIPKPTLQRIPVNAPIEKFIAAIKKDGGCICTDFVTPEDVATANAEVKPFLDADKPWQVVFYRSSFSNSS